MNVHYDFSPIGTGSGTTAYILDTGIYPTNKFFGGRAEVAHDELLDQGSRNYVSKEEVASNGPRLW